MAQLCVFKSDNCSWPWACNTIYNWSDRGPVQLYHSYERWRGGVKKTKISCFSSSLFLWTRTRTPQRATSHISLRNHWFSLINKRESMKNALDIYQIGSWMLVRTKHRVRQSYFLGIWSDLFKGKFHPEMKNSVNIRFHGPQNISGASQ